MKSQWIDYKYGSWLVLVFGSIDIKIVALDIPGNVWGILINPDERATFTGTLDAAKTRAENILEANLRAGLAGLNGARTARMAVGGSK